MRFQPLAARSIIIFNFQISIFNFFVQFKPQSPGAGGVAVGGGGEVVADDTERAYFGGVGHMGADAGAEVVVADADKAQGGASVVGELAEVHLGRHFVARHELVCHWQILCYYFVDTSFQLRHLLGGGLLWQTVVAFAFLAFDMCVARPLAAEHPHHGLVKDMLRRVHWRVFLLVVFVEDWLLVHNYILRSII